VKRNDGRSYDELRPITIIPDFQSFAEGSALIKLGKTHVLCSVSVEERVPNFLRGSGTGWITAEYAMLPRATATRTQRDSSVGHVTGRNQEIQRLIGRSLRAIADLDALGERTLTVDCDVIQADGGTRTASITGAFVALALACERLRQNQTIHRSALIDFVAAVSVGIVDEKLLLDLDYSEDSTAEVDMNVVMTGADKFVEVQGTAEGSPFSETQLDALLKLARAGIHQLIRCQQEALNLALGDVSELLQDEEVALSSSHP